MGAVVSRARGAETELEHEACQYLTFQLDGEVFGVSILVVKEIIEYGNLTPVPLTPPYVRGVINLRGAVVPVIDLAVRFDRPPLQPGRRSCIVIVEVDSDEGQLVFGAMVDAVNEVLDVPAHQIEPPPSFGARLRNDFIAGMGKLDRGFVVLLDTDKVLSVEELALVGNLGESQHLADAD
ncbi:chemotaxis protein CheW [Azoarcus indigens]|uniref:Purine-binding chemotaxis protein CheW n=1 Tax=Azoarcus indigens TaxID=29545 RepID=A0A4R6DF38_9RHOO|nr:chemotaxis protein CheW [Azoarcus indigens]NMG67827.1 chemotaxis protein CheW [Azoarcus indigens]TDN43246.1 purine-binding chemotaxis protein CheW [Azoarcus indigens]